MRSSSLSRKAVAALLATAAVGSVAGFAPGATASVPASTPAVADFRHPSPYVQERNKRVAVHVLRQLFEEGNLKVADQYIRADYIQHNPTAPDGREAIKNFIRDWHERFPDHMYNVKRVIAQGDLVMVHSNPVYEPGTRGSSVVDIFRFDKKGMIAEHWDVVQEVPETTVNGNDMFGTVSRPRTDQPGPRWMTPFSQKVATAYFDTLLVDKNPDAVRYLTPEYYQHNPTIPNGSAGLREQFTNFFQQFPNLIVERKRVIAEGDLVAIHAHYRLSPEDRGQAVVDIFRVGRQKDGTLKILEHWDSVQDVPSTPPVNDNTMF
ncbi:nuclear transport factor 2 family protein [Streptomyces sp. NBC_01390]|uniref:nuclear transport factor 2 family protein n=1 Tax=Streptomyces sp. NBC_01390 TaxID=2903850 RepID=UPI0032475FDC